MTAATGSCPPWGGIGVARIREFIITGKYKLFSSFETKLWEACKGNKFGVQSVQKFGRKIVNHEGNLVKSNTFFGVGTLAMYVTIFIHPPSLQPVRNIIIV
jgi:hypothetical protein